jgi:serine/threonine protein kinase/tetratricopeptide (TPR) repeat protein
MDLPLPIAALARRARNAKSPKERHDAAWFAWEASVRLAVAARPPADSSGLAAAPLGRWVAAVTPFDDAAILDATELLAVYALFADVGLGKPAAPRAIAPRRLLDALPAYRNQVIGHGAPRDAAFYEDAAERLSAGLAAAWAAEVFWPRAARLVYAVPADAGGARLLDLTGPTPAAREEVAPTALAGGRLYLRLPGGFQPLYPWLLGDEGPLGMRVLFFNGRRRTAQHLDFVSGEPLRGAALAASFPGIEADLAALFRGAAAAEPEPEPPDPALFGDYRLLGKLGEGGMGAVFLARQESLGRLVALKMLPPALAADAIAAARFRREIAALSRADHPNVVKILASGEQAGTPYYAMELVEGADLAEVARASADQSDLDAAVSSAAGRVRRAKAAVFANVPEVRAAPPAVRLPGPRDRPSALAALFRDAARGLHHLHDLGIVHRDVKPGNLMVAEADRRVVVMDLGLAAVANASRSLTRDRGALLGTLGYMAPEQLERGLREVDRRADVYGLGATLYELLAGRPLFQAESEARLLEQVLRGTPPPLRQAAPGVPRDLAVIVEKAIEKDPRRRYDTAEALARDLDAFLEGRPIAARPPTLGYVLALAVCRNKLAAATIAVALLAAIAGTAAFVVAQKRARDREALARAAAEAAQRRAETNRAQADYLVTFMIFDLRKKLEPIGRLDALEDAARMAKGYFESVKRGDVATMTPEAQGTYASALIDLGHLLREQGHLDEALDTFREARDILTPLVARFSAPWLRKNLALVDAGTADTLLLELRLEDAIATYRAAIASYEGFARDDPRDAAALAEAANCELSMTTAFRNLGRADEALESARRAIDAARRALAADPASERAKSCLAWALWSMGATLDQRGDCDGALASLREATATARALATAEPGNFHHWQAVATFEGALAQVLARCGAPEDALASYGRAIEVRAGLAARDPANLEWQRLLAFDHRHLAEIYVQREDFVEAAKGYEAAREIMERLLAQDSANTSFADELGLALGGIGFCRTSEDRPEAAIEAYRAAIPLLERAEEGEFGRLDVAYARGGLAEALWRTGDLPGALSETARALEADPKSVPVLALRAAIRYEQGAAVDALADANRALALDERCAPALLLRGRIRAARGEDAAARADLERFVELAPSDPSAPEARALLEKIAQRGRAPP